MIKKIITGILLGLLGFGILYFYFLYAGEVNILRNRIQTYPFYTAIFFVSLILLYTLQGENKRLRFVMLVIVVINLFILGDIFFRNNIGLNSDQFLSLFGLFLLALIVTYITHWIRYILMGIIGIGIVFVLLTGILPLYENIPNMYDFISSQKTKIINQGTRSDGILTIKNALGTKEIPINKLQQNDIDLSQKTQISFASKTQTDNGNIFIDIGNGSFIHISPQSAITLEQSGNETIMQILQGNIEYYIPSDFSGALQIIGKYTGKNIENTQDTIRSNIINQFEQKKEDFFINQIGGNIVLNPVINNVIKFFITTLYSIHPTKYQKNLNNYTTIQSSFGKETTKSISPKSTGDNFKYIIDDIMSQIKKGTEETIILHKIIK